MVGGDGRGDGNGGRGGGSGGSDGGDGSAGDGIVAASHTNRGVDARSSAAAAYPLEQTSLGLRSVSPLLSSSGTMLWLACRWLSIRASTGAVGFPRHSPLISLSVYCLCLDSCPGWICVSLLWDLHRPSCVHPHRVRERGTHRSALVGVPVPVLGRKTVFRLPINQTVYKSPTPNQPSLCPQSLMTRL